MANEGERRIPVGERLRQEEEETADVGATEENIAPPGVAPEPTPEGKEKRRQTSLLDMLFREAEVIAHNLKESGTRR